jgi:hypothetical protein
MRLICVCTINLSESAVTWEVCGSSFSFLPKYFSVCHGLLRMWGMITTSCASVLCECIPVCMHVQSLCTNLCICMRAYVEMTVSYHVYVFCVHSMLLCKHAHTSVSVRAYMKYIYIQSLVYALCVHFSNVVLCA